MAEKEIRKRMYLLAVVFVGALNWGLTAFNFNVVEIISNKLNNVSGHTLYIDKLVYLLVAISAVILIINRNTWLPFLGWSAIPSSLIPNKTNEGDKVVEVQVKPNMRVLYWGATQQAEENPDVELAYNNFSNSGVVVADEKGIARLVLKDGTDYIVPGMLNRKKLIKKHVHYRTLDHKYGMISPVKTVFYE
jgi:uncharacterized membrane protein YuzA (DUF378 family)